VKNFGNTLIGMTGNMRSYLASHADIVINTTIGQEACPNNLAPTTSTTAQMVMGDAIAICLMEVKGFQTKDFAKFHPGGALGKKLYLRVAELIAAHARPFVSPDENIKKLIIEITKSRLGAAAVINPDNSIAGIVTDGDVRRMFEKYDSFTALNAKDIMSVSPKMIESSSLAAEALELMREHNINQLIVTESGSYAGIVHLQDLIREGII
jgi:arabinose-5-phosphate isomerase